MLKEHEEHVKCLPVLLSHWHRLSQSARFSQFSHYQSCLFKNVTSLNLLGPAVLGGLGCWWQASCLNSAPYFERQLLGAHQAAPSDQAAVSMWHPAKTTGQQPPQNNNVQNCLQFLKNNFGHIDCCFRREDQMRTLST